MTPAALIAVSVPAIGYAAAMLAGLWGRHTRIREEYRETVRDLIATLIDTERT